MSRINARGSETAPTAPRPAAVRRRRTARRTAAAAPPAISHEPLERRTLMAVSIAAETLVNVSKMRDNQTEGTIAIDPTNPNRLFMASNMGSGRDPDLGPNDPIPNDASLFGATSTDAGVTWSTRTFATGPIFGGDNLPMACCDPSAEFDQFGNLWFTYLGIDTGSSSFQTIVLLSTDGGQTFTHVSTLGTADQPTITTGAGSVWVSWNGTGGMQASGTSVTGLGQFALPAGQTPDPTGARGQFTAPEIVPGSLERGGTFGDIAIGPAGQVMLNYQAPVSGELPSEIWAHVDPDGFGPAGFGAGTLVTNTNVGGFDLIPAQNRRSVDAEANIEWDRSGGPFNGRVYMAYTNEAQFESQNGNNADLDVYVRFSDDQGQHWSEPFLVNDDVGLGMPQPRAQFLPQIALDQSTGKIAVGFHDTRNDTGVDRDFNDDAQYFLAVGTPTADRTSIVFTPNVRVGVGQSDAKFADSVIDFGDYTGLAFYANTAYPAFADNSDVLHDNPAGARRSFDMYTGRVRVTDVPTPPPPSVTPGSPLSPTPVDEQSVVRKGKVYNFKASFTAAPGAVIDPATLGDNDFTVTGPGGFSQNMTFRGASRKQQGRIVLAKYRLTAPGGKWDSADNGMYTITLNQDAVRASDNVSTPAGVISHFLADAKPPKSAGARKLESDAGVLVVPSSSADDSGRSKDNDDDLRRLLA